jgi:hypothetical protein
MLVLYTAAFPSNNPSLAGGHSHPSSSQHASLTDQCRSMDILILDLLIVFGVEGNAAVASTRA